MAATLAFLERHRGFGTAVAAHSVPPSPISAGRMHRLTCRSPDFHRGATRGCWPRPAAAAATACKSVGCEPFISKGPLGVRATAAIGAPDLLCAPYRLVRELSLCKRAHDTSERLLLTSQPPDLDAHRLRTRTASKQQPCLPSTAHVMTMSSGDFDRASACTWRLLSLREALC